MSQRARVTLQTAAVAAGLLLFTQVLLPGGSGQRGTPAAILFVGVVHGLLNALSGSRAEEAAK